MAPACPCRPGALLLLPLIVAAVLVAAAQGTRLHAVDSTAPWSGGGDAGEGRAEGSAPTADAAPHEEDRAWSWRLPQAAMSVVKECLSTSSLAETGACVRSVAARALDRAARSQREISLGAGLVLVPDKQAASERPSARSLDATAAPEAEAPADDALGQRLLSLLKGYSLRLQLPSARTIREVMDAPLLPVNGSAFTGRRRNGNLGPLLVFGSSLLPVKMSLLALLVGKALMLSTLAFAIPALRLLQQGGGMGGGGGGGGGHHCH